MSRDNGIQLDPDLQQRIEAFARASGCAPGEIIRLAFETYAGVHPAPSPASSPEDAGKGETLYDKLVRAGLVGCIDDPTGPTDLSANKAHFEGFGRD